MVFLNWFFVTTSHHPWKRNLTMRCALEHTSGACRRTTSIGNYVIGIMHSGYQTSWHVCAGSCRYTWGIGIPLHVTETLLGREPISWIDSEGFWRWCITHRIAGVSGSVSEMSCFLVSRIPDDGKVQKNSNPVTYSKCLERNGLTTVLCKQT
jgi:hypothetical protein